MSAKEYRLLKAMTERLPFDLGDTERVNTTYLNWRNGTSPAGRRIVEVWTYCYVRRYYLQKFALESSNHDPAAFDELISTTFTRIQKSLRKGTEVTRYASWVSVICKNTFRNYLKRKRAHFSADSLEGGSETLTHNPPEEVGFVREEVEAAIERLPDYLQTPARRRLIEGHSYEQIGVEIDKDVAVVRSYVSKALKRLRKDAYLLAWSKEGQARTGCLSQ